MTFHKKKTKKKSNRIRNTTNKRKKPMNKPKQQQPPPQMGGTVLDGGTVLEGGTVLARGTHGSIHIVTESPNWVRKTFSKSNALHCTQLQNEYEIQSLLHTQITNDMIYVPKSGGYQESRYECSYQMERIFPIRTGKTERTGKTNPTGETNITKALDYYLIVNMTFTDNHLHTFSHSSIGYEAGPRVLETYLDLNALAYNIGQVFSQLHFELAIDGYDCELIYGTIGGSPRCCLVDYDKANTFQWTLGYESYRKLDEQTVHHKVLSTETKFAWYLYGALISMSLVPTHADPRLVQAFFQGYSSCVQSENALQVRVFHKIVEIHAESVDT